jgi:hypothetical protein
MKRVIFLDIDGVLTSARVMPAFNKFDTHAVDYLKWICYKADAKIVISSTWRYKKNALEIFTKWLGADLHEAWCTPNLREMKAVIRGDEINAWLYRHQDVSEFAILDDDEDFYDFQKPFLVKTCSFNGVLFEHWEKLREMFGIKIGQEKD